MRARTRIKICCIASADEAALAIDAGADALGLVSAMPSGPGVIDEAAIAVVVAWLAAQRSAHADSFLLTALCDAAALAAQHARCPAHTLQLVDRLPVGELARLRQALPGVRLVQVVHVEDEAAVAEALAAAADVDALLL
ncbi:MAG: phosphoribosylanthranilate isomerase, partial [Aquabacterium sp.]